MKVSNAGAQKEKHSLELLKMVDGKMGCGKMALLCAMKSATDALVKDDGKMGVMWRFD